MLPWNQPISAANLPLSKCMAHEDYECLRPELALVDEHFQSASEQHPARRWEYAMAIRAMDRWEAHLPRTETIYDVGGAGSPFATTLSYRPRAVPGAVHVVDPQLDQISLEQFVLLHPRLADAVFCLSVIEHVDDLPQFLYHLSCLVRPGGLLMLTMDCWNQEGPDTAHFSHMRQRIFTPTTIHNHVFFRLVKWGFKHLDQYDPIYHGDQLYGSYSFASLALERQP